MLKKANDSKRIRRRDVVLDHHIFNTFLRSMATGGVPLVEIVLGLELYLEQNGNVVAECWFNGGESFDFRVFKADEWEIREDVDGLTRRVLEVVRPKPSPGAVIDIFTGKMVRTR